MKLIVKSLLVLSLFQLSFGIISD